MRWFWVVVRFFVDWLFPSKELNTLHVRQAVAPVKDVEPLSLFGICSACFVHVAYGVNVCPSCGSDKVKVWVHTVPEEKNQAVTVIKKRKKAKRKIAEEIQQLKMIK